MSSLFDADAANDGDRVAQAVSALVSLARRAPAGHFDALRDGEATRTVWQTFLERAMAALPAAERTPEALLSQLDELHASLVRRI